MSTITVADLPTLAAFNDFNGPTGVLPNGATAFVTSLGLTYQLYRDSSQAPITSPSFVKAVGPGEWAQLPVTPTFVNLEGQKASYVLSLFGGGNPLLDGHVALAPTYLIQGSASKVIKIVRVKLTAKATAQGQQSISAVIFRGGSFSGGTPALGPLTGLNLQHVPTDPVCTASVTIYSAIPTAIPPTTIACRSDFLQSNASPIVGSSVTWEWNSGTKRPTLVGTQNYFGIVADSALAGQSVNYEIEWTEE